MRDVEPQAQDWSYQQTGRIWNFRSTPDYETKCPKRIATLTKKKTDFSLKIEMGGKAILGLSRLDYPLAKTGETVNGGAESAVHLDR